MHIKSMFPDVPPPDHKNLHDFIFRRPDQASWKDFTVYIDAETGRKRSYREFLDRVYDGATALGTPVSEGGLGLRAEDGEMVGILSENCIEYSTLIHSVIVLTVPFALLSSHYTPFELEHAMRLCKVTRLFVHPKLLSMALSVAPMVGLSQRSIYILEGHATGRTSFDDMVERVRINRMPRLPVRPAKEDTLAYLVLSSGTGGLPKAVMISHGNIYYSMIQIATVGKETGKVFPPPTPTETEVRLAFLPFHHAYALHVFIFRAFLGPCTSVILPKWNIEKAILAVEKYKVSRLSLVPSHIHQLVNYPKINEADFSSVVHVTSGAAYLPPNLAEKLSNILSKEITMVQGYGMSECTNTAVITVPPGVLDGRVKVVSGSLGILLPGMEARVVRDDGSESDINEPGELWLKGANIAMGYWNDEKANKELFVDGWLRTGDRMRIGEHGTIFFEDRAKDTLKVSGMQVSPAEIEDTLLAQPDKLITDVAVAGVSGGRTADEKIPRAWVVLSSAGKTRGSVAVVGVLEDWYKKSLSRYKWLRGGIEIVDEIPKSPTGKVLRRLLQTDYEARKQQPKSKL